MTISQITWIQKFIGLSTDGKPTEKVRPGATFYETDTTDKYVWTGSEWVEDLRNSGGGGTGFGLAYKGAWNANSNSPALASGAGTPGDYYIVGTQGATNLDGITDWKVGDWAIFASTNVWQKIDQTVPLTDSTSTTSSVIGASATAVKAAYDLASLGSPSPQNILYADLVTAIGAGTLTPGKKYRITDFRTTHYIVDGDGNRYHDLVAQVNTVTLTGTDGTASISGAGGLTKTATFASDLPTTAANFVTAFAADYLGNGVTPGIVLTSNAADLIFTANVPGTAFTYPIITNLTDSLNGTSAIITMNDNPIIVGAAEPLIVTALANNKISTEAYSENYPQDKISYDWDPANWSAQVTEFNADLAFCDADDTGLVMVPGFKGVIFFRHDTLLDNYMGYDFRNCKFRRWKTNTPAYSASGSYTKGDFVNESGFIYRAQKNFLPQIDTLTLSGTSGTANVTDAGGLTKLATFALGGTMDLAQTAADFVTSWAADYLGDGVTPGIVLTSNGADLIFTANVPGTAFTSPVITNVVPDLSGSVVNTQANVTPETPFNSASFWVQCLDLSLTEYWNVKSTDPNGISSGIEFIDVKTFAEGSGTATYERCCRSNHFESFKDDYYDYDGYTASILSNNVFFLQDGDYYQIYSNEIAAESFNNTIGNNFRYNTIGNNFNYNTIGNYFYSNTIGNNFYSNTIGNNFGYNTIGNNFNSNTIGNNFNYNTIGKYFFPNTIGNNFRYNTIGNNFNYNTIGNNFQMNCVEDGFNLQGNSGVNFSSATLVYAGHNCVLYVRPDYVQKLRYYNNSDELVIELANA